MFFAFNSRTVQLISSLAIELDTSYLLYKEDIWYANPNDIESYDKEKVKDVTKIEVKFRHGCNKKSINGKEFAVAPHFYIPNKEKLGINLIPESPEHLLAKNFIYGRARDHNLKFKYSTIKKPTEYDNIIDLEEIGIDYNRIGTEIVVTNGKRNRADIIIPFKKWHDFFGIGVVIEIQFSNQMKSITSKRNINWAIKGYSVCWLWDYDFIIIGDYIEVKEFSLKLETSTKIISEWKKEVERDMMWRVQDLGTKIDEKCRELDLKIEEIKGVKPFSLGNCQRCNNGTLVLKKGKFGDFYGCSNYPICKNIVNIK